jgi:hypothetical protein
MPCGMPAGPMQLRLFRARALLLVFSSGQPGYRRNTAHTTDYGYSTRLQAQAIMLRHSCCQHLPGGSATNSPMVRLAVAVVSPQLRVLLPTHHRLDSQPSVQLAQLVGAALRVGLPARFAVKAGTCRVARLVPPAVDIYSSSCSSGGKHRS